MADRNLKIALILSAVDKASGVMGKAFSKISNGAKSLQHTSKAISDIGDKSLVAGGVLTAFFGKTVEDARESVKATARLEQVFKSMGETSNKAAQQAADFAGNLEFKIGIEDEEILAVQAKLATFKRASNELARDSGVFNRATSAAFDLSAAGFGDALSNITQLGKALQNPALGAAALAKAGAINKEDMPGIKFIQATKGIPAAQEFLLRAVEKQVKGVAERTADPIKKMQIQFTESSEAIGKALLPEVNKLADKFATLAPKIINFVEKNKSLVLNVAKAGVALLAFGAAMKTVSFVLSGLSTSINILMNVGKALRFIGTAFSFVSRLMLLNPIGLIITAIAVAGFLIYKNWKTVGPFFSSLWKGITSIFSTAIKFIGGFIMNFTPIGWFIKLWKPLSGLFKALFGLVKVVFKAAIAGIGYVLLNFTPVGLIFKHWNKIKPYFMGVWNFIKGIFTRAISFISSLGKKFYEAGANIINSIIAGITSKIAAVTKAISNVTNKIRRYLPFSPAKEGPLKDIHRIKLVETIAQSISAKPLTDAWQSVANKFMGYVNQPVPVGAGNGGSTHINFNPTINLYGGATQQDGEMLSKKMKDDFEKLMRNHEQQKQRIRF